ncbi:HAMP domain-containing sensor histidine kinase [Clostridium tetani]|uniref:histidine kinase n=3 Tax=Clostridium tetani TaxID=1513 RepID=A0ABY0ET31_CLOTA|nr:HAMP domain-containing sensor histidine kinase [Clostridium tetani]KHO40241.1 histidine kinase [Clostridium tetani]RXI40919.1 sensor histidine kinase [Clostridium tetani]RXI58664.1 sensor histidine kinase [Clostridium tetani]CDI48498.1 sensor histidine kinase [Clostridium tetani 12124569]
MKFSLRYKFTVGLIIIFCIGFNVMSFFMNKIIVDNSKKIISKEFVDNRKDLSLYIRQFMMMNNIKNDEDDFQQNINEISEALSLKLDDRVIFYKNNGQLLLDTAYADGDVLIFYNINKDIKDNKEDLKTAFTGKSAFSIINYENNYIVAFSFPINIDGKNLCIMRYSKDYSYLFELNRNLLGITKRVILIIFILTCVFTILLSTKITIPIVKLSKVTKEISKGNFDLDVNINSSDEIGELGENFNLMKCKIKEQIEIIKRDRDNLERMESYRKIFFDNVTHEMKTPLTIISGYAQMILDDGYKDEKILNKGATKIKIESNRMYKMVLDLLTMSKLESYADINREEKINIEEIINTICEDMTIRANKYNIKIKKCLQKNLFICGNKEEIRRMIINIIDNSIKYGNVKSTIIISLYSEDNFCVLTVEDEGKGIPENKIHKIYDSFYRVCKKGEREKDSNGLGLTIVKSIVEAHKGKIKIESTEGLGTKVYINLPCLQIGNNCL